MLLSHSKHTVKKKKEKTPRIRIWFVHPVKHLCQTLLFCGALHDYTALTLFAHPT